MSSSQVSIKNVVRALRLPFASASVLPFLLGSFIKTSDFRFAGFLAGLAAAVCTHLSANLMNDYADSVSGADWKDLTFYGFFGGSKLIQERTLGERFFLGGSLFFAACACLCVLLLALQLKSPMVGVYFLFIITLAWMYSAKPLQLSYHRVGEFIIFLLFGPILVMGAYFIQTLRFPALESFLLSLPMGFFVTSILFVNEVPDYRQDRDSGKYTWVSVFGPASAWKGYLILMSAAFISIAYNVSRGSLSPFALTGIVFFIPAFKAASILRVDFNDKMKLLAPSKLTIGIHIMVSVILIADLLFICRK